MMPRSLSVGLRLCDWAMLLYWSVTAATAAGLISLPADQLYRNYDQPLMVAWNWSFMPLDVAFALTGLASVRLAKRGDPRWRGLAILSLALTMCAGGMALSFWTLIGDFSLGWWLPNLLLLAGPLIWLRRLLAA